MDEATIADSRVVLARHARSFRLAGRFLPGQQLDEAAVLYSFCRTIDDAVDEAPDLQTARAALAALSAEFSGTRPAGQQVGAWLEIQRRRRVPPHAARDLLAGMHADLDEVRIADDAALTRYSYQVAGTVGLMMCGVLGVTSPVAWSHAVALGVGMQITNICRDVVEDAGRGRIYLPARRLRAAGIHDDQLLNGTADRTALAGVISDLLELAEENYAYAQAGMHHIPWRARPGILIAGRVYRAIGLRLRRVYGCDPTHGRTITTPLEKLGAVLSGAVSFFHPVTLGLIAGRVPTPQTQPFLPPLHDSTAA